jgi:hypothetical protein
MSAKIRIKMGEIEVDYEGPEEFLKDELPTLMKTVSELYHAKAQQDERQPVPLEDTSASTSTIANKLAAKSGPDLAIAAALFLTKNEGDRFTRAALLKEMRSASAYYKATYNNNLTETLRALVKNGRMNELGGNSYSLSSAELQTLRTRVAR